MKREDSGMQVESQRVWGKATHCKFLKESSTLLLPFKKRKLKCVNDSHIQIGTGSWVGVCPLRKSSAAPHEPDLLAPVGQGWRPQRWERADNLSPLAISSHGIVPFLTELSNILLEREKGKKADYFLSENLLLSFWEGERGLDGAQHSWVDGVD